MKIALEREISEPSVQIGIPKPCKVDITDLTEDGKDSSFKKYNLKSGDIICIPDDTSKIEIRKVYIRKPTEAEVKLAEEAKFWADRGNVLDRFKVRALADPYNGIPTAAIMAVEKVGTSEWMWVTVASLRHYGYLKNANGDFVYGPLDNVAEVLKDCKNDYERIVAAAGRCIKANGCITCWDDKWVNGVKTDEKYERNIVCLEFV